MKRLLILAFFIMCLSGCSTAQKAQTDVKKIEFVKGCMISTTITLAQMGIQVDLDRLYSGCSQMEHEFRKHEKKQERRYNPLLDSDRPEPRGTKFLPTEIENSEHIIII